jgi:hypothetical protein
MVTTWVRTIRSSSRDLERVVPAHLDRVGEIRGMGATAEIGGQLLDESALRAASAILAPSRVQVAFEVDSATRLAQDGAVGLRRRLFVLCAVGVLFAGFAARGAMALSGPASHPSSANGASSLFVMYGPAPSSGPPGTAVTVHGSGCAGAVHIALAVEGEQDSPLVSTDVFADANGDWSASADVPADGTAPEYRVGATCLASQSFASALFVNSAAQPYTPTTLKPTQPLTLAYPQAGPAGTDVTVEGSQCSSDAGHVEVFFISVDAPDVRLANAGSLAAHGYPGDWSTVLQVPDVDPSGIYLIGAQCSGDGAPQGHGGEQVEYFGYLPVRFTFADTIETTIPTMPTTTIPAPPGFILDVPNPDEGAAGTVVTVTGSGCGGTSALIDAYFSTLENDFDTAIGPVVHAHPNQNGDWTVKLVVPAALDPDQRNIVAAQCMDGTTQSWHERDFVVTPSRTPPPASRPVSPPGYWMIDANGTVYAFGHVHAFGNTRAASVSHIEPTPSHGGYWIVTRAGHVYTFGNARSYGSAPDLAAGETVSTMSATPSGHGYWLFTNRGRVLHFGDAPFYGDMSGAALNGPVVGSVATPTGHGYFMVASDGGVFGFGDAKFHGSMGDQRLNQPVNGIVPTADNRGYWLVASDGGIFGFNAPFRGSMGGRHLTKPVIGMVRYGNGYLMVASDGGVFDFSNKAFVGSLGNRALPAPVIGIAA